MIGKRLRGALLRLALKRTVAVLVGLVLISPAVWIFLGHPSWETPETAGLGLVLGATGAALILAAIGGRRPDWIDPEDDNSKNA